ncbi:LAFE_0A05226g1_1 [Lachancea fermentati]|uniref:LAFE_0A05226g1_1 n=1 Tax=Lachancea fermentati TaxID=4955 RepID=A0A1G4M6S7_LACFM|nr:LAFE_0A05226g1_1 [Lachancea fermentati]
MGIDCLNYDVLDDITIILSTPETLSQIDELVQLTNTFKLDLEDNILQELEGDIEGIKSDADTLDTGVDIESIFKEINETKALSKETELAISQLTKDISYVDNAKRNLTQSMTMFQNLKLLSESYFSCRALLDKDSFIEMASPYKVMCGLAGSFQDYKSVDELSKLLSLISRLQVDTLSKIKNCYERLLSPKAGPVELDEEMLRHGACELLETNKGSKAKVIDLCLDKLLYDISEIFQVDDEAGSLENLSRRYVYFKKVLNNFNSTYANYFPSDWEMPFNLTMRFFALTKKDLHNLLEKEVRGSLSIDVFMDALQTTLEFEKYINVKFANKLVSEKGIEKISTSFEPYLTLWISHQDKIMSSKMLTYMSEEKLPQTHESLVVPSSADLFRTYRSLLSQTLELAEQGSGRQKILKDLAQFFTKWLSTYLTRILQPLLLQDGAKIEDKNEVITYTLLLINTADYCSTTVEQLAEKLNDFLDKDKQISGIFDPVKNSYGSIISKGINFLLSDIVTPEMKFAWREFENYDWKTVVVEDYSRYTTTFRNILSDDNSSIQKILPQFNREVFTWNFLDRVVDTLTEGYLDCIIKLLRPDPPFGTLNKGRRFDTQQVVNIGEQLLLDVEYLKQTLYLLAEKTANEVSGQNASYKRLRKHIDQNIDELTRFMKLLVLPTESADIYEENYATLTDGNTNIATWAFILSLKGTSWDLAEWKRLFTKFNRKSRNEKTENIFIFLRCRRALDQFLNNLAAIMDPAWKRFIQGELKIKPINSPRSPSISTSPSSPSQKFQGITLNDNIKNLMSNTGFFNRGN